MHDHLIICGYGVKGQSAADAMCSKGMKPESIVVIDPTQEGIDQATRDGHAGIRGDASKTEILREAGIEEARGVIVAPDRDDTAVLTTLTARELNADANIVVAIREEENIHLAKQSGASSVIVSAGATGRMLGIAMETPQLVGVVEEIISLGRGIEIGEREILDEEAGPLANLQMRVPIIAIIRDGQMLRFDDDEASELYPGDHIVYFYPHSPKR